jgi:hypothetical protein
MAVIEGEGGVSFDNCHFYVIARAVKGDHIIHAKTGRLSITDSVFLNFWDAPYNMTPIVLEPDVINAVITNNDFYGKTDIVNRSKGKTIIKDNIFESNPDPQPDEMPSRQD